MSKKPFVQEYIENRFEEAKEYEVEIARLKAEAIKFCTTPEGGWFAAWQSADKDRQSLKAENERLAADKNRLVEALEDAKNVFIQWTPDDPSRLMSIYFDGAISRINQALKEVQHD